MQGAVDVLIVGAGVAGLAAAGDLTASGLRVTILDARDRIGGRIYTRREAGLPVPVELGAEFVHGRPPETWQLVRDAGLLVSDVSDHHWSLSGGVLLPSNEFWSQLNELGAAMERSGPADRSFKQFAEEYNRDGSRSEAVALATTYVQGFHAAHPDRVSVRGLVRADRAEESIEGDSQFRILSGYDRLVEHLRSGLDPELSTCLLNTVVTEVRWQRAGVELEALGDGEPRRFRAARAVITLPLGVMQAAPGTGGSVRFVPSLPHKEEAVWKLEMGQVVRLTLRFREAFWEELELPAKDGRQSLKRMGFLHSRRQPVPTWWTLLPVRAPVMVGWAGGPVAEQLLNHGEAAVLERALDALAASLQVSRGRVEGLLEGSYLHDWQADPFSRGAYSYVPVGGLDAQAMLAEPVEDTLFFAGEATNTEGHHSTVHGAIATGRRAAAELLAAVRNR